MPRKYKHPRQRGQQEGDGWGHGGRHGERGNYQATKKENATFERFYKNQGFMSEDEWDKFIGTLRTPLPSTFRVTGTKSQAKEVLRIIKSDYFDKIFDVEIDGKALDPPKNLPWYPEEMAWQLDVDRRSIRNCTMLKDLHEFLITETESGNISRQEAVSMIPPLVLDIKQHHKVLDMCAAPGSKTAQLIEMLHADTAESYTIPEGCVIANDADNKRCYLMTHQVKRLESPSFMIINHDATMLPNIKLMNAETEKLEVMRFDRVLADVPCSGDGTMRKNVDAWKKWNCNSGHGLHNLQSRIARRGLELLAVGGRLVYSTCSMNPVEDEAVISNLLRMCEGAVELIDVSHMLPGLKYLPGKSTWKIINKEDDFFEKFEDVPERFHTQMKPSVFPPTAEEAETFQLHKCMRILPHLQNTGGFFIAALEKKSELPWLISSKADGSKSDVTATSHDPVSPSHDAEASTSCEDKMPTEDCEAQTNDPDKALESTLTNPDSSQKPIDPDSNQKQTNTSGEKDMELGSNASMEGSNSNDNSQTGEVTEPTEKSDSIGGTSDKIKSADSSASGAAVGLQVDGAADGKDSGYRGNNKGQGGSRKRGRHEKREHRMQQVAEGDDPPQKRRFHGFREDPFLFFKEDDPIIPSVKSFYGLSDDFPANQLYVRCDTGKKRNIYFTSSIVRNIVKNNEDHIKFINLGVKFLSRSECMGVPCDFRTVQEGLWILYPFSSKRVVTICKDDIVTLLSSEMPFLSKFTVNLQAQLSRLSSMGSVVFLYDPKTEKDKEIHPQCKMLLCGWMGKASLRSFLPKGERAHYLRMCGKEMKSKEQFLAEKAAEAAEKKASSKPSPEAEAAKDLQVSEEEMEHTEESPKEPTESPQRTTEKQEQS